MVCAVGHVQRQRGRIIMAPTGTWPALSPNRFWKDRRPWLRSPLLSEPSTLMLVAVAKLCAGLLSRSIVS